VLGTYLERHPGGEFAPIARALIEHYERQLKAEVAAREQERKRLEEEKKAAEVKRLEQERRAREAALAEERRRAEEAKNLAEAKVVEEKQRAEWQARTEELRMALEEAWLARGAAKAADMERTAAVKAAEEPDVEASRAIRQAEVGAARTMIDRTEERFGLKPQRLVPTARFSTAIRPTPALRRVEEWGRACSRNRSVISLGYTLVTDNERDFAGVSGLSAENWLP
jgi:hypothetical protein